MDIKRKILTGYLSVFLLFSILGLTALFSMAHMQQSYSDIINRRGRLVSETKDLLAAVEYQALMLRTYLLTGHEEYQAEFSRQLQRGEATMINLERSLTTDTEKALFANLKRSVAGFTEVYSQAVLAVRDRSDLTDQEKLAAIINLTVAQRGTVRGVIAQGEEFVAYQQQLMDKAVAANATWVNRVATTSTVVALIALLLGIAAAMYISHIIVDPVRQIEEQVRRAARGDFTGNDPDITGRDEIGRLAGSIAVMFTNLRRVAEQLKHSGNEIESITSNLRTASIKAVTSAGESTTLLNHVNAAVTDLTSWAETLSEAADRASQQALELERTTEQVVQHIQIGDSTAAQSGEAVRRLETSLSDIRDAVASIVQFASQADLLAHKAGEQFLSENTVDAKGDVILSLARETRTRAREAARAASEVNLLIATVQQNVKTAVSSVEEDSCMITRGRIAANDASKAFSDLIKDVRAIATGIADTTGAIRGFSIALEGVSQASQAQEKLVEDVARAGTTLNLLVGELRENLDALKL